jgi:hypothetical protein
LLVAIVRGAWGTGAVGALDRNAASGSSIAIVFFTEPGPGAGDGAIAMGIKLSACNSISLLTEPGPGAGEGAIACGTKLFVCHD